MKKIFIGNGKVTKIIANKDDVILGHDIIDITNIDSVNKTLKDLVTSDSVVINTAAKISLEWCEKNKLSSYQTNTVGPMNVLDVCSKLGAKFVQISSGCIYDGNDVKFNETMQPKPAAWYAMTKAWADDAIVNFGYANHLILRPRQLISPVPYPTNMLTKFLSIKNISCIDEQNSVTCIEDFGDMLDHLVKTGASGIFNCANVGTISPYTIAKSLSKLDSDMRVEKISYDDYLKSLEVKRVNTILDIDKLISTGYTPRHCCDALSWCVENYGAK